MQRWHAVGSTAPAPRCGAVLLLLVACLGACGRACGGSGASESPADVVEQFLKVMERSGQDEAALLEAYELLDQGAQRALSARATRARALSGQDFEPWQMLAQARFRLRFEPARGGMSEKISGERAVVVVNGTHASERAEVPLVREHGRWRIQLVLPAMRSDVPGRQSDG